MTTIITLKETAPTGDNTFQVELSFDHDTSYPLTITRPPAPSESDLEWYFERYLNFPFTDQVKFQTIAQSLREYGQALFAQVFKANIDAYATYRQAVTGEGLVMEIVGSHAFQHWHWEALQDPQLPEPLAVKYPFIRKPPSRGELLGALRESATLNVLLVVARPEGRQDVGYRTIARPLVELLHNISLPVHLHILRPGTREALAQHLEETGKGFYHIIHFDTHGALLDHANLQLAITHRQYTYDMTCPLPVFEGHKPFVFLATATAGQAEAVDAQRLTDLLTAHAIPIVMLNACQSAKQTATETSLGSHLLQTGAHTVVAMAYTVTVSAAKLFMQKLYQQLFAEKPLAEAIRMARWQLHDQKQRSAYFNQAIELEDWLLPVVYQRQAVKLPLRKMTLEEEEAFLDREAARFPEPLTTYGFFGRDVDILELEQRLLLQGNMLLLQGMGGMGKTTLLQHLGWWWQTTQFVAKVFYFGYDQKAWTRQQLLHDLAQQLWETKEYQRRFVPRPEAAQQEMVVKELRAQRYMLILDNLESVTAAHLAIPNTLSEAEQANVREFMQKLRGGQTLVLLGSRGEEAWLARGTFGPNIYRLGGLDGEAASNLVEKILANLQPKFAKKGHEADLQRLLTLLAGHPLALQVVLANLNRHSPAEILQQLATGEVALDSQVATGDKTQSILRCIEYSHSNLSPDAQQLLLCLSPFIGVICEPLLPPYTEQLQQQPLLKDLPFAQWSSVLQEAKDWGLLTIHPEMPEYLQIQPILPYFLRNRLQTQSALQQAIETAFREVYNQRSGELKGLLTSKEPKERLLGQAVMQLEYENVYQAFTLALKTGQDFWWTYSALEGYLGVQQNHASRIHLGKQAMAALKSHFPPDSIDTKRLQANVCHNLGMAFQAQQQWQVAQDYYQQALQLKIEFNDRYRQAGTYHQLGTVAQEQRQWAQAQDYYQQALQLFLEFNDCSGQASTYHNLGWVAETQRQWVQAQDHYQHALQLSIEFNDRYGQARTYHHLGLIAEEQRQWTQAQDYYQQALQICIEFNDRYRQANIYSQLGMVAQNQRQWAQAQDYYQHVLQIYIEFNDRYLQSRTYNNLGIVAQGQRQWAQAQDYYQQALQLWIEFNDRYEQARTYHNLGMVAQEQR